MQSEYRVVSSGSHTCAHQHQGFSSRKEASQSTTWNNTSPWTGWKKQGWKFFSLELANILHSQDYCFLWMGNAFFYCFQYFQNYSKWKLQFYLFSLSVCVKSKFSGMFPNEQNHLVQLGSSFLFLKQKRNSVLPNLDALVSHQKHRFGSLRLLTQFWIFMMPLLCYLP